MTLGRSNRAFSLIEVVLAMGVVAFAVVAILAVFPAALASNRSGMNEGRAAQLVRALVSTIDAQSTSFDSINCYGATLDLKSLKTPLGGRPDATLYATYPSRRLDPADPNSDQPSISTSPSDAIYSIELRFDNDPPLGPSTTLGAGKVNLIEIRIYGSSKSEGATEYFYLARNKG